MINVSPINKSTTQDETSLRALLSRRKQLLPNHPGCRSGKLRNYPIPLASLALLLLSLVLWLVGRAELAN